MPQTLGLLLADKIHVRHVGHGAHGARLLELAVCDQAVFEVGRVVKIILNGGLAAVGDDEDLLDARSDGLLHDVLDHGLVDQGQHLLGDALGVGQQAGTQTRRGDDGFSNAHDELLSPRIPRGLQVLLKRSMNSRMALIIGSCRSSV